MSLLPDQTSGREDDRRGGPRPLDASTEVAREHTWRRYADALGRRSLEQQRRARALCRGEEQIRLGERQRAVGARSQVPVAVQKRDRLPDREHQTEFHTLLELRRLHAVPVAEL